MNMHAMAESCCTNTKGAMALMDVAFPQIKISVKSLYLMSIVLIKKAVFNTNYHFLKFSPL